jgi:hypothetical protein
MAGGQLIYAVALAMVVYAAAVEGGCRSAIRLTGPLAHGSSSDRCGQDRTDADTWRLAVSAWRQQASSRGVEADGPGLT